MPINPQKKRLNISRADLARLTDPTRPATTQIHLLLHRAGTVLPQTLTLWVTDKPSRPPTFWVIDKPSRPDRSDPTDRTDTPAVIKERSCKDTGKIYRRSKPEGPGFSRRGVMSRTELEGPMSKGGSGTSVYNTFRVFKPALPQ